MIYIVNYGAGNILSITSAISEINQDFQIINKPVKYNEKDILLIPGVGNFKSASKRLMSQGFSDLKTLNPKERPFIIGICLGMQLLLENSSEGGTISDGLGLVKGKVRSIQRSANSLDILRTNTGWTNYQVEEKNLNKSFEFLDFYASKDFYYVHSFMCIPSFQENVKAYYREADIQIPAVIGCNSSRVLGFQFHPEKSGPHGLALLSDTLSAINANEGL